ncbi:MAG: DUF4835 family protein [Bacteroidales bacterium]
MKKLLVALMTFGSFVFASAQEFNCKVKINADQIEGTYKQKFVTLETELTEFINNRKWSEAKFSNVEKVDCTLQFTIKSITSQDRYAAELTVQARRPVYNAAYTTSTFNFKDNEIEFPYVENEPIVYTDHTIESNLVAIVSYYMYMILGMDFDSFAPEGGTPFFRQAENIVTLCQTINETGWKAFDSNKNRHALVSGLLEEKMKPFRQLWYEYHRKGLDDMVQNAEKGKSTITKSLDHLQKMHEANSMSVLLSVFMDTKTDELINIYSKSNQTEKDNVYKLLTSIYPSYSQRLDPIRTPAAK